MTQIEQIKAEIERLKQVFVPTVNEEYRGFAEYLLDFIVDDIKSLFPTEQPSEESIKDLIQKAEELYGVKDKSFPLSEFPKEEKRQAFIKGAQWQKEQLMKSAVSIGYLQDWYQNSIDGEVPPIWTDEHLNELTKDFYIIPKQKEDNKQ